MIRSTMQMEGQFDIAQACALAEVSRAGFYRDYDHDEPAPSDLELRDALQMIVLENRCY